MSDYVLYGMPASLYTGKPRSYLRKQNLAFVEAPMGATFREEIVPRLDRFIVPVLVTPAGELVQDGADIIDYVEKAGLARWSAYPDTPKQRLTALIFELFGGEGLLRPAMHYRWDFPAENERFLRFEFGNFLAPGKTQAEKDAAFDFAAGRMKKAAEVFGVSPESTAEIEASYAEFLSLFGEHCAASPYLLGGRPSIGDYGLLAPLFAHLARDPKPADLMRRTAPAVARWVERMNAPGLDMAEFGDRDAAWLDDDAIPATLMALLRFVAREYLGEIAAHVAFLDEYLGAHPEIAAGDVVGGHASKRVLGRTPITWRGIALSIGVFPYRVWLLQRVQDAFDRLDAGARAEVQALLDEAGLADLVRVRPRRRIERRDNREVWGAPR